MITKLEILSPFNGLVHKERQWLLQQKSPRHWSRSQPRRGAELFRQELVSQQLLQLCLRVTQTCRLTVLDLPTLHVLSGMDAQLDALAFAYAGAPTARDEAPDQATRQVSSVPCTAKGPNTSSAGNPASRGSDPTKTQWTSDHTPSPWNHHPEDKH